MVILWWMEVMVRTARGEGEGRRGGRDQDRTAQTRIQPAILTLIFAREVVSFVLNESIAAMLLEPLPHCPNL